jgi:hypothetical protein
MNDSESQSPSTRKGFERRWIKNANYTGPERRSGNDRRRYPPLKEGERSARQEPEEGRESEAKNAPGPNASGTFKPFHP